MLGGSREQVLIGNRKKGREKNVSYCLKKQRVLRAKRRGREGHCSKGNNVFAMRRRGSNRGRALSRHAEKERSQPVRRIKVESKLRILGLKGPSRGRGSSLTKEKSGLEKSGHGRERRLKQKVPNAKSLFHQRLKKGGSTLMTKGRGQKTKSLKNENQSPIKSGDPHKKKYFHQLRQGLSKKKS